VALATPDWRLCRTVIFTPEGMTSQDIRIMSEDALLDMDYFLNDDELDDGFGEEGFYIF